MSLTQEEKEQLFLEFQERMYLNMPDVIGNLIIHHMSEMRIKEGLYNTNPEFKKHPDIVASVLMSIEGANTLDKPKDIINKAAPEIKRRIESIKPLELKTIPKRPDLSTHGEL